MLVLRRETMSSSSEVKLLNLAEAEKEKDSGHLSEKYGPEESFSPAEPPAEKNEPMSETSGISLSSDAAKKKEEGGKKEEKEEKRGENSKPSSRWPRPMQFCTSTF